MQLIRLQGEADVEGWRREARALMQAGIAPDLVAWQVCESDEMRADEAPAATGLFDHLVVPTSPQPIASPRVPAAFVDMAEAALLHDDPQRFGLVYRLLWRMQHEPGLRHDPLDPDWLSAAALARSVRHEQQQLRAFVRFHEQQTPEGPQFVAWFETRHHVVASQAGFFQRRFARMRWAIFTPRASIAWDGEQLHHGGPARREDIPLQDEKQALWLAYYASIFNPARLKLKTMVREMPRRYWQDLPEARLIAPLAAAAMQRTEQMVLQPTTPARPHRHPAAHPPVAIERPDFQDALTEARSAAAGCAACPLAAHATQLVWGEGPTRSRVMLVGEQPGDQEDLVGRPFVGPAGELLDRALQEAGVDRASLYLTNAVKHFGFELRGRRRMHKTPGQREVLACNGWLRHEIDSVGPTQLVALGATAALALLGTRIAIEQERGRWLQRSDGRQVLVTWHPAALLRMAPGRRAQAWRLWVDDLAQLRAAPAPQ